MCQNLHAIDLKHQMATFGELTGTGTLRRHLYKCHLEQWVDACDRLGIKIKGKNVHVAVQAFRQSRGQAAIHEMDKLAQCIPFSPQALIDTFIEFIVANDLAINIIESPQLRKIILMLREELTESDIPHRTTVRK
ncbi:uncharacterized protein LAESUDRAFT_784454 [Laetiporus sulphureus 93-53]|uniref:Uncharacterized protein n=1 Tax=Laetiporus sulphureus 93-53 TaxID=1314785 RepID=A0A165DF99_9APHY|nr:uncharacterized protein LAESUDRAFT_784454 [Laetiporus sulphureus 93-53]KZT04768.1 hypothetical protein LAESUDRAFT_784454 [Laetiporus sulphureus 93-53]